MNKWNPYKRRQQGLVAKREGQAWEQLLKHLMTRDGWEVVEIPPGCRGDGRGGLIRVKTAFDFVAGKNGRAVFFDAKSVESGNFTKSQCTVHQVDSLFKFFKQGFQAGYFVNFRDQNLVVFFSADKLMALKPRTSLKVSDGLALGTLPNLNWKVFDVREEKV